jgi:hypothetical protein
MAGTNITRTIDRLFAKNGESVTFAGESAITAIFETGPTDTQPQQWGDLDQYRATIMLLLSDLPSAPVRGRFITRASDGTEYEIIDPPVVSHGGYVATCSAVRRDPINTAV